MNLDFTSLLGTLETGLKAMLNFTGLRGLQAILDFISLPGTLEIGLQVTLGFTGLLET